MEQGFWGAVLGAIVGSLIVGFINVWLQMREHGHAGKMQQAQWNRESEWRRDDKREAMGLQIQAQDAARTDQRNEWDRQREDRQNEFQHQSLMAVQEAVTRLSDASRWIYLEKLGRHWFERDKDKEEGDTFNSNPKIEELSQTFRDLRFNILPIISRGRDDKVRNAAVQLYFLDLDMVLLEPTTWQSSIYGGDDPVQIQEMLLPKFIRMAGKLLRGESIDDESFPKNLHATGVRGSEEWFQTSSAE